MDKVSRIHTFVFNKGDNSGEQLILTTTFHNNGDPPPNNAYIQQQLSLQSYCNSASFNLFGAVVDSAMLRKLANELDEEMIKAKNGV